MKPICFLFLNHPLISLQTEIENYLNTLYLIYRTCRFQICQKLIFNVYQLTQRITVMTQKQFFFNIFKNRFLKKCVVLIDNMLKNISFFTLSYKLISKQLQVDGKSVALRSGRSTFKASSSILPCKPSTGFSIHC